MLLLFILGAVLGSFLNVCIHRIPAGESIIWPASHCPKCQHQLSPLDLIPILSYLFLRGRCRFCKKTISARYPLVELLSGGSFLAVNYFYPALAQPMEFVFLVVFMMLLIIISLIDFEHQLIPDAAVVSGVIFGLAFNLLHGMTAFINALFGAGLGFAALFAIAKIGKFFFKKEAVGEGDLYLAAFIGAYLGWQWLLLALFLAYLLAGFVAAVLLALGKVKVDSYVPFGPALAAGGAIALFFGEPIINWYFHFLVTV